jgi:hypothetical protein
MICSTLGGGERERKERKKESESLETKTHTIFLPANYI